MIVYAAAAAGAILGALTAHRRGGRWPDMAQYAAGFGIAFGLTAMILSIIFLRQA